MVSANTQAVIEHYTRRHEFRQDLFGDKPYANYGYWTDPFLTLEQAADALTDRVARAAGIGTGDDVLDVGCGYGAGAVSYGARYRPASIVGIDVTDVRIGTGNAYVAQHGLSHFIRLQLGDATRMSFADETFDKLISVECAFHFDTRVDFLREAARVLKHGGRLALTDIIPRRGADPARYLRGEKTTHSNVCLDMPVNAYDADVYARHLADAGFRDVAIESILERTRVPFANALARVALDTGGERGAMLLRMAQRIRELIGAGEDYVLVTAQRA